MADHTEEDETENENLPERKVLLGQGLVLPLRRSLGRILRIIRVLPLIIPDNAGERKDPNAVAESRTDGERMHYFQRISERFLSPNS
jgi:hypothetical protein